MPAWALTLSYGLHLLATVALVGGLFTQAILVLPAASQDTASRAELAMARRISKRFQPIAWLSLAILAGTGMLQMTGNPSYRGFVAIENPWSAALSGEARRLRPDVGRVCLPDVVLVANAGASGASTGRAAECGRTHGAGPLAAPPHPTQLLAWRLDPGPDVRGTDRLAVLPGRARSGSHRGRCTMTAEPAPSNAPQGRPLARTLVSGDLRRRPIGAAWALSPGCLLP